MRNRLIPEKEIIDLTKNIVQGFYNRNIEQDLHYLSDDFVWIGAFSFQYTTSKEDFLKITTDEINSVPFQMINEEFSLVSKSSSSYVVCAKFNLISEDENNNIITTHTRLTVVWKYIKQELKLIHIHGSNAQDVPLIPIKKENNLNNDKFLSFINSLNIDNFDKKIAFKGVDGTFLYFMENDIIYLKADLQNTYLHTTRGDIKVSGILAKNNKKLPACFYRIHKKYVLNSNYVKFLKRYTVTLTNDEFLPISKERFMDFRNFTQHIEKE